jgi:hypothetical protein
MYPLFISFFGEDKTELGDFSSPPAPLHPHPRPLSKMERGGIWERGGGLPYRKYLTMKADETLNSQLLTLIQEASMSKINDTFFIDNSLSLNSKYLTL